MRFKVKDHYFHKAKKENFLARSIYKLEEIDHKFSLFKQGQKVVDLGYYPGSWTQYLSTKVGEDGVVVGLDIQPIQVKLLNLKNVKLFQKDIFELQELKEINIDRPFDVVCSDMAPSTTGIMSVDQARSLALVEKIVDILPLFLRKDGHLVVKIFESQEARNYLSTLRDQFGSISYLRPKSTRSVSKEFFMIAKNYKKITYERV